MTDEIIRIVLPVALRDVFDAVAPAFEAETGHRFETTVMLNPEVPGHIASGARWSVAASNPHHVREVVEAGGCEGGVRDLGLSPLALAVTEEVGGAPARSHEGIAMVLGDARSIAITGRGTSGAQFDRLMDVLDLREALEPKVRPMPGGGPMAALLAGEVDVATLPLTNVAPIPGVRAAALCPLDMDVHVDLALCIHAEAGAGTRLFADRLTGPGMDDALHALGLWRRRPPA